MARFTCAHIKKDGTICGNKCCDSTGCYRHWHLFEKNKKKKPCLVCGFPTPNDTGCCAKHSAKSYALNYRMREKYKAEGLVLAGVLQPKIPEAPIFELGGGVGTFRPIINEAPDFELGDVVTILQPRIYEAPVFESDGEDDEGLGLFGD